MPVSPRVALFLTLRFARTIVSKDISRTFLHTNFFALRPILNALLLINDHHIAFHADRLCRADLNAHLTSNATNFAQTLHLFPRILSTTRDPNPGVARDELNNCLWTGPYACTATHTSHWIYHREIINHGDGIEGANLSTLAEAHTGISTPHGTTKSEISSCAGTMSDIIVFLLDLPLYSRASNGSHQICHSRHLLARYFCHFLSHFRFTRKAKRRLNLRVIYDRLSIGFASSVATTSSLGSSQDLLDFLYLGVNLDCKFVGGQSKSDTKQKAYGPQYRQTPNGQFDQQRIHVYLLLSELKCLKWQ
jgi:hypothetical protein